MAVDVSYEGKLTIVETVTSTGTPFAASSTQRFDHTGLNNGGVSMNAATTVPATKCANYEKALSAGAASIDLTTHTGTNGATQDMTGLKVQAVVFKAKATNSADITIKEGTSNGHPLFGTGWLITLKPGQEVRSYMGDLGADVASGDRTWDLTGTGTDVMQVSIVAG